MVALSAASVFAISAAISTVTASAVLEQRAVKDKVNFYYANQTVDGDACPSSAHEIYPGSHKGFGIGKKDSAYLIPDGATAVFITGSPWRIYHTTVIDSHGRVNCNHTDVAFTPTGELPQTCNVISRPISTLNSLDAPIGGHRWNEICGGNPRNRPDKGWWSYPNPTDAALFAQGGYPALMPAHPPLGGSPAPNAATLSGVPASSNAELLAQETSFNQSVVDYDNCRSTFVYVPKCIDKW